MVDEEVFTDAQHQAWERMVGALRVVNEHAVQLDASVTTLDGLTERVDALSATLREYSGVKPVARFRGPFDPHRPDDYLPYSPVSGRLNPLSPPVSFSVEGTRVIARVTLGMAYEGGVGFAHGGVVSMIWDQVLALANVASGVAGPTGELRVRYLAPTPLAQELRFEAWHDRSEGRRLISLGRCYVGDTIVTEAEGVFIQLDQSKLGGSGWGSNTQSAGTRPERRRAGGTNA